MFDPNTSNILNYYFTSREVFGHNNRYALFLIVGLVQLRAKRAGLDDTVYFVTDFSKSTCYEFHLSDLCVLAPLR